MSLTGATIDVRGDAGGGIALIGGDYMGGNPNQGIVELYGVPLEEHAVPTAQQLTVDADTVIDASAVTDGDGGKVVNWSDGVTDFAGTIISRGGSQSGNGGFVEVSGLEAVLFADINVDLVAPNGDNGTILFDPTNMVINAPEALSLQNILNTGANAAVTAGNIVVAAHIIKTAGGDATLTLTADDGVVINSGVLISSSSGALNLQVFANADLDTFWQAGTTAPVFSARDELNTAYLKYVEIQAEQLVETPLLNPTPAQIASLQNSFRSIVNFQGTIAQLALFLNQNGHLTNEKYNEFLASSFINNGVLALNGGTASISDNQGSVNIGVTFQTTTTELLTLTVGVVTARYSVETRQQVQGVGIEDLPDVRPWLNTGVNFLQKCSENACVKIFSGQTSASAQATINGLKAGILAEAIVGEVSYKGERKLYAGKNFDLYLISTAIFGTGVKIEVGASVTPNKVSFTLGAGAGIFATLGSSLERRPH